MPDWLLVGRLIGLEVGLPQERNYDAIVQFLPLLINGRCLHIHKSELHAGEKQLARGRVSYIRNW